MRSQWTFLICFWFQINRKNTSAAKNSHQRINETNQEMWLHFRRLSRISTSPLRLMDGRVTRHRSFKVLSWNARPAWAEQLGKHHWLLLALLSPHSRLQMNSFKSDLWVQASNELSAIGATAWKYGGDPDTARWQSCRRHKKSSNVLMLVYEM